jgi:hypothetical protein
VENRRNYAAFSETDTQDTFVAGDCRRSLELAQWGYLNQTDMVSFRGEAVRVVHFEASGDGTLKWKSFSQAYHAWHRGESFRSAHASVGKARDPERVEELAVTPEETAYRIFWGPAKAKRTKGFVIYRWIGTKP